MNTLKLSVEKKQTSEVEIQIPCFFRNKSETDYIGVLDAKTIVNIYQCGDMTIIKNTTMEISKHEVSTAYSNWITCTESEFLEKYDAVVESISLHPKLAV